MLSQTVSRLCALCALSAFCTLLLPESRRKGVSLIASLLCMEGILSLVLFWAN